MSRPSILFLSCAAVLALALGCGGGGTPVVEGATPLISSIEPASGGVDGGTPIVIRGANLANPVAGEYQVLIGGQPAEGIEVIDDTQVECMTPPGTPGAADVEIVTVEGVGEVPGGFMFYPPPTVTAITPAEGTRDGGVMVTVTGSGFTANDPGETICLIELKTLENIEVIDDTTLTGLTPSSWTETFKDVTVVNRNGSGTLHGAFTYVGPVPLIHSVTPTLGPRGGGTLVTVTGEYFTEAGGELSVRFGSAEASLVTRIDDETLTCMTPLSAAPGFVDVSVGNNNGEGVLPDGFFYIPAPILTAITPTEGPSSGGTAVTITGEGFAAIGAGTTLVSVGPNLATSVVIVNDTTITCVTASGPTGVVDVQIVNGNGADTLPNAYEYTFQPQWDSVYGTSSGASSGCDDCISSHSLSGFTFPFFGSTYTNITTGSNGTIGIGTSGTTSWSVIIPSHPHIAVAQNDFHPGNNGTIYFKEVTNGAVITYDGVGESPYGSGFLNAQVHLDSSGAFAILYKTVSAVNFYTSVGPSSSGSSVDWSSAPTVPASQASYELFFGTTDLQNKGVLFLPDGSDGYTTTVYTVN